MYPVFETIQVVEQYVSNLASHTERMQHTARSLWNCALSFPVLERDLKEVSVYANSKCRVLYNATTYQIDCIPYQKRQLNSLRFIQDNNISYPHKFTDRNCITQHTHQLNEDENIIIIKDQLLTDASYANIALWNGTAWHTPASPLLNGTKRALLLRQGELIEKDIRADDLSRYEKIALINAMLNLGDIEIPLSACRW